MIDSAAVTGAQIVDPVLIGCRSVAKGLVVVKKDGFCPGGTPPADATAVRPSRTAFLKRPRLAAPAARQA